MNAENFISGIKKAIENTQLSVEETLQNPPGRFPDKEKVELSEWYKSLAASDKERIKTVIAETANAVTFKFFCILDGVAFIEDIGEKGTFELYFQKHGVKTLLNNPDEEYLHDLFNQE